MIIVSLGLSFSQVQAQKTAENYTKKIRGGNGALMFSMGGLMSSTPGLLDGLGIGGRYMLSSGMAVRGGFGLNNNTNEWDPKREGADRTKDESNRFGVEGGVEILLFKRTNLLLYTGGLAIIGMESTDPEGDDNDTDSSSITASGILGVSWFLTHNVSAGAEYRLGIQMDSEETDAGDRSITTYGVGAASILMSFWF